jgi:hypothetical protein
VKVAICHRNTETAGNQSWCLSQAAEKQLHVSRPFTLQGQLRLIPQQVSNAFEPGSSRSPQAMTWCRHGRPANSQGDCELHQEQQKSSDPQHQQTQFELRTFAVMQSETSHAVGLPGAPSQSRAQAGNHLTLSLKGINVILAAQSDTQERLYFAHINYQHALT